MVITRSQSNNNSNDGETCELIFDTLDPIQKTFSTQKQYLKYWRFVLYKRYVSQCPRGLNGSWQNYGYLHVPYPLYPIDDCLDVPEDLFQSTLTICKTGRSKKQTLKIHVYYSTYNFLIQGSACRTWVDKEFETLVSLVHTLAESARGGVLRPMVQTQVPEKIMISVPPLAQDELDKSPAEAKLRRRSANIKVLALLDEIYLARPLALTYSLPSPTPPTLSGTAPPTPPVPHFTESDATPLETTTPLPVLTAAAQPDSCASGDDLTFSTPPHSHTSIQAKNDYHKDNERPPTSCSQTQTEGVSNCCGSCHSECISTTVFERITDSLRDEISALRAALRQNTQQHKIDMAELETLVKHYKGANGSLGSPTSDKSIKQNVKSTPSPKQSPKPKSASPASTPVSESQNECSATTTQQPFPKQSHGHPVTATNTDPQTVQTLSPGNLKGSNDHPDNKQLLVSNSDPHSQPQDWPELKLTPDTSTVIIGDSVVAGLHQTKMAVDKESTQVLSISGLDRTGLLAALKGTVRQPRVTTVVLHIGINDCKRGYTIGNGAWRNMITGLRRCFPAARLMLSSILPRRKHHGHITSCIDQSNYKMQQMCDQHGATFIDNDATFYTESGDVKTGWLRDDIHPNNRGSSGLAINIKRAYSLNSDPPLQQINSPRSNYSHFRTHHPSPPSSPHKQTSLSRDPRPHPGDHFRSTARYSGPITPHPSPPPSPQKPTSFSLDSRPHPGDHFRSSARYSGSLLQNPRQSSPRHPIPKTRPLYATVVRQGRTHAHAPAHSAIPAAHSSVKDHPLNLAMSDTNPPSHISTLDKQALLEVLSKLILGSN